MKLKQLYLKSKMISLPLPAKQSKALLILYFYFILFICANASASADKGDDKANLKAKEFKRPERKRSVSLSLPKEVIVIGGGIAGLAAARTLTKDRSNFTVKVYEAQKDRYGGRVWTDKLKNMKARGIEVELGMTALNVKAKNNPLLKLAESFELETASLDNPQFIIPWKGMTIDGDDLSIVRNEALQILGQALNESKSRNVETSVKDAVDAILKKKDVSEDNSAGVEMVKCLPTYIIGDYSAHNYRPEWMDAGYERVLLDGMGELVDRLLSGSSEEPPLHIYLNKAVRQIKVDDEKKKVIVRTTDGLQAQVDAVVIAVPSTVIAANDLIFDPPLPKEYERAFQEMKAVAGNNVIVEFERSFWPNDFGVFIRAVKSEEERGHFQIWFNIHRLLKNKPVLTASVMGAPAIDFEKLTDEEAEMSVLAALTDMFGEEAVKKGGKIVRLQRSKWVSDPLFRGTFTYPKVGFNPDLWDLLSEPLCPYVYFAGEHTDSESPGTVHGAYNSGVRVGNQILSRLCDRRMEEERIRKETGEKKKEDGAKNGTNDDDDDDDGVVEEVDELYDEKDEL